MSAPIVSDGALGPADVFARRLADLEAQVRELSAARRLEASSVGGGSTVFRGGSATVDAGGTLRVLSADGTVLVELGLLSGVIGGEPVYGARFNRDDGSAAIVVYDPVASFASFAAFQDHQGNIVVSTDGSSGQGLATPYVPGAFHSLAAPTDRTISPTFVTLQRAIWRKQHPRMRVWVLAECTSTTAELQWIVASGSDLGTVLNGPITINNGFGFGGYGPFSVPGEHLSEFQIDLQARVASGAGDVGVATLHAIGLQS